MKLYIFCHRHIFCPGRAIHIHWFHQYRSAFLYFLDSPSSHLVHDEVANHLAVLGQMEQMEWMHEVEMEEEMREVVEEKSMAKAGGVDAVVKEVELHPSWRK